MIRTIIHLLDDANFGGVTKVLQLLTQTDDSHRHRVEFVTRGTRKASVYAADVVVSHMAVCWQNLPYFSDLRAKHPSVKLYHVEHSYCEGFVAQEVAAKDRFADLLGLSYALFDGVIAVSEAQGQWLIRREHVSAKALHVIPSCAPLAAFSALLAEPAPEKLTIAAIGRFHRQKGFDILIRAFQALKPANLRLELTGDGPDAAHLRELAQNNDAITFYPKSDSAVGAILRADVVAMPSRWEPYGLVALEARAAGRPVVVSMVDGLRDQVAEGAYGLRQNTLEGWIGLLQHLQNEGLRAVKLAQKAIAAAKQAEMRFVNSWNRLIDQAFA